MKQIDDFLEYVKVYYKNLKLKLQNNHLRQTKSIKNEYDKLRSFIDEKETEMIIESKRCLAIKESELETIFGKNSQVFTKFYKLKLDLENTLSIQNYFSEDSSEEIMTEIQDYKLKMDHNSLMSEEGETDLELNQFEKLMTNILEDLKESLNNTKAPYLLDNLDKVMRTFSDKETKELYISDQDRDLPLFGINSHLIVEYSEGVLEVNTNGKSPSDVLLDFQRWNGLHTIQLNLGERISKEDLQLLSLILKRSFNPSTLEITLEQKTHDDSLYEALLLEILSKFHSLKVLSLEMPHVSLSNESLEKILNSAHFNNLETLILDLEGTKLNDKNLIPLFIKMQNLRQLVLKISETQVTDEALKAFGQITFTSLEEIELTVEKLQITDLGMENFLRNLTGLKRLDLDLRENLITDKAVQLLSQTLSKSLRIEQFGVWLDNNKKIGDFKLKQMQKLKRFGLGITGTQITDQTLKDLGRTTLASSPLLKDITLYARQTNITDLAMENFLRNLKDLKRLDLDLRETSITDQTVSLLSQTLSKSPMIENVEIWLADTVISDLCFPKFFKALPNVKTFSLNLNSTEIGNKTLEIFIKNTLLSMKNLESLALYLSETYISDRQANELLANIPDVEKLIIHFNRTEVKSKSIKLFLKERLSLLTSLNYREINLEETYVKQMIRDKVGAVMKKINKSS